MKKNIWIWNHYATNMFENRGGRHYWFAKYLIRKGYQVTIFCAATKHNSSTIVETESKTYTIDYVDEIPFVFVKTSPYRGNGFSRINNMISFYRNLYKVYKDIIRIGGKPDVILSSSVHPLTLIAGIKIAKKLGIPCICEIRDLWPETLVAYGSLKKNRPVTKLLYLFERKIYAKADKLIFTMEGGKDYILQKKWDKEHGGSIEVQNIFHINNGIDMEQFDKSKNTNFFEDEDLMDSSVFKVVYTGSVRRVNFLEQIIDAAKYVQENSNQKIAIIIFGDGPERGKLEDRCSDEGIHNVIFKGNVNKRYVPSIVCRSDINLLHYMNSSVWTYGGSQNKLFEYLASGKPVLSTISMGYDIIKKFEAGVALDNQSPESIGKAIIQMAEMDKEKYKTMGANARCLANKYDFDKLTDELIKVIQM